MNEARVSAGHSGTACKSAPKKLRWEDSEAKASHVFEEARSELESSLYSAPVNIWFYLKNRVPHLGAAFWFITSCLFQL